MESDSEMYGFAEASAAASAASAAAALNCICAYLLLTTELRAKSRVVWACKQIAVIFQLQLRPPNCTWVLQARMREMHQYNLRFIFSTWVHLLILMYM